MFTTNLLSRFMQSPNQIHHGAVKRLLPYSQAKMKFWVCSSDSRLVRYTDRSGLVVDDIKSASGYAYTLGSGISRKQEMIAQSNQNYGIKFLNRHFHSTTWKSSSHVITCKAAVCSGIGEPVKLEYIEVEPPKASEVRVKMLYASLCHTDILCSNGFPVPVFPRALGHEGVGVVESVGEGVTEVKEGDLVIPTFLGECQECENCRSGKTNLCSTYPLPLNGLMLDNTSRMSLRGQTVYHIFTCSTWSEYTVININYVVKIDPRMNLQHASYISCGFTTGFGATWKEAKVQKGSTVAVFGLGAVGLGAVEGARMQGAAKIIGIDKNERKRAKGQVFGMTDFINPHQYDHKPVSELLKEVTGGAGTDYCFECTGVVPLVNEALKATKAGKGTTILIGATGSKSLELDFLTVLLGRTLKGSIFGGIKIKSDLPLVLEKCANKEIQLDELRTHEISLDEIERAFDLMKQPDCVKVLIKF